ncbi:hypothetical protein H0G77_00475 [[Pasteurella] aerogenes]|nr:hypothetical protein [[Pasteurella] aerogenes]
MKVVHKHIYSVMIFANLPYSLFANQTENFSRLNQIDATQQQRQQHIQQAQDKILQPQSDVRLNAALVGKDPVTIQKEQFAIDVAKVNGTTPEQEYPWISNGIDLGWLGDFEGWGRSIKGLPKTKWSDFVKKAPVNYPSQTTNLSLSGNLPKCKYG